MTDADGGQPANRTPKAAACAICGKPPEARYRPFCSKRCADVDLHRWLGGRYAIPADPADDADADGMRNDDETE